MKTKKTTTAAAKKQVKKSTKVTKPAKAKTTDKKVKTLKVRNKDGKVVDLDITQTADGKFKLDPSTAGNDEDLKKILENATVEKVERPYKFDERLVPYYVGGDSKEDNLAIRTALVSLGKTKEMTSLFNTMKEHHFAYRDDAKERFIQALYSIIRGHDDIGLSYLREDDVQAIHDNNKSTFDKFFNAKDPKLQASFEGLDDD